VLEGEVDAPVFLVRQGTVRVYRTSLDGREQTLIRLGPGAAFNMPAAFASLPSGRAGRAPASVVALDSVTALMISRSDFCQTVVHTPELALAVLRDLASKVHHLTDLTRDLGLLTVRARLAGFLLSHGQSPVDAPTPERGQTPGVRIRWTHQEIAAQIGTVREVVSRTMRAFVREEMISLERHRIVVLDREALIRESGM
jgi:CRP-like cAMP-binding protein